MGKTAHVYDGRNATDALLGTFSGLKQPFTIQPSGRSMLIYLAKEGKIQQSTCNFKGVFTFIATMSELLFLTHGSIARAREFFWREGVYGVFPGLLCYLSYIFRHFLISD